MVDLNYRQPMYFSFLFDQDGGESIRNSTNFDVTEINVDIAIAIFSFCCLAFSFGYFDNSDVINVVSESESSRAFTTVLFAPCIAVTGITCKSV